MSRRIFVLLAAMAVSVSSFAAADRNRNSDDECTRQEQALQERTTAPTLEDAFVSANAASIETADGVSAMVGPIEVVVARFGPDGKPVMACVDNPEAARRFFKAPAETLAPKQKKEQ